MISGLSYKVKIITELHHLPHLSKSSKSESPTAQKYSNASFHPQLCAFFAKPISLLLRNQQNLEEIELNREVLKTKPFSFQKNRTPGK